MTKIWCQKNKINTTRLWSSEALKSVLITEKNKKKKKKKSLNGFWSPAAIHTSLFFYCTDLGMIIIPKINKDYHPLVIKKSKFLLIWLPNYSYPWVFYSQILLNLPFKIDISPFSMGITYLSREFDFVLPLYTKLCISKNENSHALCMMFKWY